MNSVNRLPKQPTILQFRRQYKDEWTPIEDFPVPNAVHGPEIGQASPDPGAPGSFAAMRSQLQSSTSVDLVVGGVGARRKRTCSGCRSARAFLVVRGVHIAFLVVRGLYIIMAFSKIG